VSRLTELIRQAREKDSALGTELEQEFRTLASRRAFGLNFERHRPEAVELPRRPVRRGDKVRILPPRGSTDRGDGRLWRLTRIEKVDGDRRAHLELLGAEETTVVLADDLVVVAEFRDSIYPGLAATGGVHRGGDRPTHTVINGENFHVLKALTYTHRGKVDAIYIDPPYNTGARDWKYNNDYVEGDDLYRHSKWLAFMERRLRLAKEVLNPERSVLIVAIGDEEIHRLGLLLEQLFPEAAGQLVTSVVNPRGRYTAGRFLRTAEYFFCMAFGSMEVHGADDPDYREGETVPWRTLRRSDIESKRGSKKGGTSQFYPIHVNVERGTIESLGDPLPPVADRHDIKPPPGCVAVFPVRNDGTEMNWGLTPTSLNELLDQGFVRVGKATPSKPQKYEISYLTSGRVEDILSGRARVVGKDPSGAVIARYIEAKQKMPPNVWVIPSHNAEVGGTNLLKSIFGDKRFDYPKSLYAVEDMLWHFLQEDQDAVVLDFFGGSGTTAHAVMRLNRRDGGRRQCIVATNNEVSANDADRLRASGLRPGDPDWDALGICDHITKPRIEAAVTGWTPAGEPIKGDYKFTDEFPMADGFEENAEFFTLTYENPVAIGHNRAFERIAPLLWLRAAATGRRIDTISETGWDVADTYGILWDLDQARTFVQAIDKGEDVRLAYVVTDDDRRFQSVTRQLPDGLEVVRLYESYLSNFRFTGVEP
jgi:adenine-specific DNA-methyltransferase